MKKKASDRLPCCSLCKDNAGKASGMHEERSYKNQLIESLSTESDVFDWGDSYIKVTGVIVVPFRCKNLCFGTP